MPNTSASLSSISAAIGFVYDRTSLVNEPICSTFMIGPHYAATIASVVSPFASLPRSLKVVFPKSGKEFGVHSISFHRKFDRRLASTTVERGTLSTSPDAALQKFNCCILKMDDELPFLKESEMEEVSQSLRFPLNLGEDGFRGSLKDIELPLVIQTLNNARKQGILYLCDELMRPMAQIFCDEGRIVAAKYHNLVNEMAIYQIVQKRLTAKFAFFPCKRPSWLTSNVLSQTTDGILIEAHRRLDELDNFKKHMTPGVANFARAEKYCNLEKISEDMRKTSRRLWNVLDAVTPADDLWLLVGTDDFSVYKSLYELFRSNQILRIQEGGTQEMKPSGTGAPAKVSQAIEPLPLELGTQLKLNPHDQIISLSIDRYNGRTKVKAGTLLGAMDAYDSFHLLHDIVLLPAESGSPILKSDLVIGMHCGSVVNPATVDGADQQIQQMIWSNAIIELLNEITGILPRIRTTEAEAAAQAAAVEKGEDFSIPGCREVASISCPNCGRKTFKTARLCSGCGFEMVPQIGVKQPHFVSFEKAVPIATAFVLLLVASAGVALSRLPEANTDMSAVTILPRQPWVNASIQTLDETTRKWQPKPNNSHIANGVHISFLIQGKKASRIYILYKGSSNATASLMYPPDPAFSNQLGAGNSMTFPEEIQIMERGTKGDLIMGGPPGVDKVMVLASSGPLPFLTNDADSVNLAFQKANDLIESTNATNGVIIKEQQLTGKPPQDGAVDHTVYATCITTNHS